MVTNMRPCDTKIESRTHIVGKCETYNEEGVTLGEMKKLDV